MFSQLHPTDRNPVRITKAEKDFAKKLDFKDIELTVKIRDIRKIEKKNSISISAFGYENKVKHQINASYKICEEKHDLLLIGEEGKRHYVVIKDFNTFMYNHTVYRGRKQFCWHCLQAFRIEEILQRQIKYCFKINRKQNIIMPKKDE